MLKTVADENIPLVENLFGKVSNVVLMPGRAIRASEVKDADILLVRSVTTVDQHLLAHSRVKFVGSATAGIEHVDTNFLQQTGIAFANAAGSNANAVAEYVVCCVAYLLQQNLLPKKARAGIIGVGNVGSKVATKLASLGFTVLQNDPPRAEQESDFSSVPLSEFYDLDLICLHTPLTKDGKYPTFHLIAKEFLKNLKNGTALLNAGRGGVVNSTDLLKFGQQLICCLDVWEHEPNINLDILQRAQLATPHIAGYTIEAKQQGAFMLYQAAQKALKLSEVSVTFPIIDLELVPSTASWQDVILQVYNPAVDTENMRAALNSSKNVAEHFDYLRKHYPKRHEFASITLKNTQNIKEIDKIILRKLGLNFKK